MISCNESQGICVVFITLTPVFDGVDHNLCPKGMQNAVSMTTICFLYAFKHIVLTLKSNHHQGFMLILFRVIQDEHTIYC